MSIFNVRLSKLICDADMLFKIVSNVSFERGVGGVGGVGTTGILGVALLPCNFRVIVLTSLMNCGVTSDAATAFDTLVMSLDKGENIKSRAPMSFCQGGSNVLILLSESAPKACFLLSAMSEIDDFVGLYSVPYPVQVMISVSKFATFLACPVSAICFKFLKLLL